MADQPQEKRALKGEWMEVLRHGMVAGVFGYAVVVVFYMLLNVAQGRSPFLTPALLGGILFYGAESPGEVELSAGPVLAFNGLHLVVFLVVGTVTAWLATISEHGTYRWYLGLSLFLYACIHALGLVIWLVEPFRDVVPVWSAVVVTALAMAAMAIYLFAVHPRLRREVAAYEELEASP